MKTKDELAAEFIVHCENVLDTMVPIDEPCAKDRIRLKTLLTKCKTAEDRAQIMALYLSTIAAKSEVVNAELTRRGRGGSEIAQARWSECFRLVRQLNAMGGSFGRPIEWTVSKP